MAKLNLKIKDELSLYCKNQLKIEKFLYILVLIFSLVVWEVSYAYDPTKDSVNILVWWSYLDDSKLIMDIEKQCHTKVYFDEYYSDNEFMRRFKTIESSYDIVIFSNTIYESIKNDISKNNSRLWQQSKYYHPIIRNHYLNSHFPSNIVYFLHSITGILANTNLLDIKKEDTIFSLFIKAKDNIVIILDEPSEGKKIIELGMKNKKIQKNLSLKTFSELKQKADVYITNDYTGLIDKKNFAFAFTWSGQAIYTIKKKRSSYKFFIQPNLSYLNTDLLAVLNNKSKANCVAKLLSNKQNLEKIQNRTFYFSPYLSTSSFNDKDLQNIYFEFINQLSAILWLEPLKSNEIFNNNRIWSLIKFDMDN